MLQAALTAVLALSLLSLWLLAQYLRVRKQRNYWKDSLRNVEFRLEERTYKLRNLNTQLYGEIALHEQTESKLLSVERYLSSIINSMPSVLVSVNRAGAIRHWNTSAERATDLTAQEVAGKLLWEVYPKLPITADMIVEAISSGVPKVMESTKLDNQGSNYFTDITIYPLIDDTTEEAVIRIDDVTLRVMLENMMVQNEKMLSLGQLAAGMAHEINNPLGAILQTVQNIERRLSPELMRNTKVADKLGISLDKINEYLKEREILSFLDTIRDAGERSARIVANMLGFSRSGDRKSEVDLNALTANCLELMDNNFELRQKNGRRIQLIRRLGPTLPLITCSAPEIQQVILNLIRNAAQALTSSRHPAPCITVSTGYDDESIWLQVTDNGPGIPAHVRTHIFEPFFTTKEVGKGTGLGLSISYFIITEHHGGTIDVESSSEWGTSFTIKLPLNPNNRL